MSMVEWVRTYLDGHALASVILLATLKASVLLLAALAVNAALRGASASLRHLVWSVAIAAVLAVPALTALVPRWGFPFPAAVSLQGPDAAVIAPADVPAATADLLPVAPAADREVAGSVAAVSAAPRPVARRAGADSRGVSTVGNEPSAEAPTADAVPAVAGAGGGAGLSWTTWLVAIWLAGALVSCGTIGLALVRTWLLGRRAEPLTGGSVNRVLDGLRRRKGIGRQVRLLRCRGRCMPMTWGVTGPAILLPADVGEWPESRVRSVLSHELAHIKRFDFLTQLLARFACALHWFNPLVWLAAARLRVERELACDDEVLLSGSRASEYAGHLLEVARDVKRQPLPGLASVAMARPSRLGDRVRAVLDGSRRRGGLRARVAVAVWLVALGLALPVAAAAPADELGPRTGSPAEPVDAATDPASPLGGNITLADDGVAAAALQRDAADPAVAPVPSCDWHEQSGGSSTSMNVNDDDWRIKIERGGCELEVEIEGELRFDDSFSRLIGIAAGGELEIEEREGRTSRRARLRQRGGQLERRYYVDGDERAFDAEAEAWLSDMLLVLFRRAGYLAEERAEAILEREGIDGLLQEIAQISSDHVTRKYYSVLLSRRDLAPDQVRDIVRQAGETIGSDYELAELLIAIARHQPLDESVRIAYVEASSSIGSDYEQRRALSTILARDELSQELARAMLSAAKQIGSDYELAELLIELIRKSRLDESMVEPFFDAVESIGSDYESRRVLDTALRQGPPNREFLDRALESAQEIGSDYELAELLIDIASLYPGDEELPASYLRAARSIGSDYELARVLESAVVGGAASKGTLLAVLRTSTEIGSDHELAELLVSIARRYELDDDLRAEYLRAADTLGSEYERDRAVGAIYPRGSGEGSGAGL